MEFHTRRRHFDATSLTKADLEKQETRLKIVFIGNLVKGKSARGPNQRENNDTSHYVLLRTIYFEQHPLSILIYNNEMRL